MSAPMLTVDPARRTDPYYRYKMPAIAIKIEGNGNGIKTVFPNIREVSGKLNRPPQMLNKFFGLELGAQATYIKADDKFLVMGDFPQNRVQQRVDSFITRFVLCGKCRSPETHPFTKKQSLLLHCSSCGADSNIDTAGPERFLTLLKSFYKEAVPQTSESQTAPTSTPDELAADAFNEDTDAVPTDETPAKADEPLELFSKNLVKKDPVLVVVQLLADSDPRNINALIKAALEVKVEHGISDRAFARTIFRAIVHGLTKDNFINPMVKWRDLIRHFTDSEASQAELIIELMEIVRTFDAPEKFTIALKMFWDHDLVSENVMLSWYNEYNSRSKPEFTQILKDKSKVFFDWLNSTN